MEAEKLLENVEEKKRIDDEFQKEMHYRKKRIAANVVTDENVSKEVDLPVLSTICRL